MDRRYLKDKAASYGSMYKGLPCDTINQEPDWRGIAARKAEAPNHRVYCKEPNVTYGGDMRKKGSDRISCTSLAHCIAVSVPTALMMLT